MQGLFLAVTGLLWPRLKLAPAVMRLAFWLAVYGCLAPLTANLLAAMWAAETACCRLPRVRLAAAHCRKR
jgi:hypothetical protein